MLCAKPATSSIARPWMLWMLCVLAISCCTASPALHAVEFPGGRISILTDRVLRLEVLGAASSASFEDRDTVTFAERAQAVASAPVPFNHTLSSTGLTVHTARVTLRLALPLLLPTASAQPSTSASPSDFASDSAPSSPGLSCAALNVTLESGAVVCPGLATGRSPLDPEHHPGIVMDTWTDIVLGDAAGGNLNGSLDTLDCYCGADCCFEVRRSEWKMSVLCVD